MGRLLFACIASVAAYLGTFVLLLSKPLTLGIVPAMVEHKRAYAAALASPKLLILGASNARYSHRCETIGPALGLPCANLGVAAGLSLDYLRAEFAPVIRPGDTVYMPLEYGWYRDWTLAPIERTIWVASNPRRLLDLPPLEIARALFQFDLKFAVSAAAEMALARTGFRTRTGLQTLTAQGDEKDHTAEKALAYRASVAASPGEVPRLEDVRAAVEAPATIRGFLDWARAREVRVIGGLPTTFDDLTVPDALVGHIRRTFEDAGHSFALLPNRSLYPRDCFYDTHYHLHEDCQREHSGRVAILLRGLSPRGGR
jgi:hypothetical protein